MHREAAAAHQTDSMRMFVEGLPGGKPSAGQTGQLREASAEPVVVRAL